MKKIRKFFFVFNAKSHVEFLRTLRKADFKKRGFYYILLGVDENSSKEEIKKNYVEIMKLIHPDKNQI